MARGIKPKHPLGSVASGAVHGVMASGVSAGSRGIKQPHPLGSVSIQPLTVVSVSSASTGVKISELPAASAVNDTDQLEVNQDGTSRRLTISQITALTPAPDLSAYALIASPTFTGDPKAPTPATDDNDTSIATTAFTRAAIASFAPAPDLSAYAPLASPVFTGNPTAPTPTAGDNDTSIATTAFVAAALAAGASASGDFCATLVGPASLLTSAAVVIFPTIISGNSGGWLNTSTGAYTPPAGRYFLTAQFYGHLTSAATNLWIGITKNGGVVSSGYSTTASAAYSTLVSCAVTLDANGSDTFTVVVYGTPAAALGFDFLFTAFPISGIKGPPGDPYPGTVGGDFCATHSALGGVLGGAAATIVWPTVEVGNSGGWLNLSNGRYTPPAGRYCLFTEISGVLGVAGTILQLSVRKNGVDIGDAMLDAGSGGSQWTNPVVELLVDANGTDWFDVQGSASAGVTTCRGRFLAYPISGIKGPPGDPGAMFLSGAGAPTLSAAKGTLYTRTDATTTTTRLYVNTDGGTTWANFTSSA